MFNTLTIDPAVALIFRLVLAFVFVSAVLHKLSGQRTFYSVVNDYRLLPGGLVMPVAVGLIVLECVAIIALLVPVTAARGAQIAFGLLLLYSVAIGFNLARGRIHIDCGCMMGHRQGQELSGWLLLRNIPLVLIALAATVPEYDRGLVGWDYATVVCAVMALGMLYSTVNHLLANGPGLRAMLVRYD